MKIIIDTYNEVIEYPVVNSYFVRSLPKMLVFDYMGTTHNYNLNQVKSVVITHNNRVVYEYKGE